MNTQEKLGLFKTTVGLFAKSPTSEPRLSTGAGIAEEAATPILPPLQLSSSASSTATGGQFSFGGSTRAIDQGDWNISNGSGGVGMGSKTVLLIAAVGVVAIFLWKKSAQAHA